MRDGDVSLDGKKMWYDPTKHCDNKCLRLGECRFSCGKSRWIDKVAYEKDRSLIDVS